MRPLPTCFDFGPFSLLRLFRRDQVRVWQRRADRIGRDCDRLKRRMQRAMAAEARSRQRSGAISGEIFSLKAARFLSLQRKATS